ncbi:uncharacterized protein LOC125062665 [Pieris napi]|uniref:uncharacterized protein LOC125062665 n=1 Tax=Pieris napi TaxID=78633 RepID=UPI001FBA8F9F|nr:uncharacterized protein LOC125062665 [Pieris napi]
MQSKHIFKSKSEMNENMLRLCYGDFYIIGRMWIETLKSVLVGANMALIPAVYAAAPPPEPKYPPLMKYKDLPLYQSPHYEYKDHVADKEKCPKAHTPLLQEYLLPTVKSFRRDTQVSMCQIGCGFSNAWRQLKVEMADHERNFKRYMRAPENYTIRVTSVALGTVSGFYLTRQRGIPAKIFGTTLGTLLAGSVSFPDESDRGFREILYRGGKVLIAMYNIFCSDDYALEERLSCREDLPPNPPPRKPQCPMK